MKRFRHLIPALVCGLVTPTLFALTPLPWAEIPDTSVAVGQSTRIDLSAYLAAYDEAAPRVLVSTSQGEITLQLRPDWAPATVANFLNYVRDGDYTQSLIHRTVPDFIIQTGGYWLDEREDGTYIEAVPTDDPVVNEFGTSNLRGTIAMAKLSSDPNSATSQWFINLVDNSANLDNQNGGFTVFGAVDEPGMTVADAIAALPRYDLSNIVAAFTECPLADYTEGANVQVENLVRVPSVTILADNPGDFPEAELPIITITENSNSARLEAYMDGLELVLRGLAVGETTLRIKAAANGEALEQTLVVTMTEEMPKVTTVFTNAVATGDNWWYSNWYGFLNAVNWPWIYTLGHGWQFIEPAGADSMWLWDASEGMGWLWTGESLYPYYYHATGNEFILYADTIESTGWYFFPSQDSWIWVQ